MKYHDKLNLKSPIYKYNNTSTSRTPTKSPIKPAINPSDLFQKVCCPNCKYAFKIIRQQIMKQNPIQSATPYTKKSKYKQHRQIQTQTQGGVLQLSNNNSPNKYNRTPNKLHKTYQINSIQNNDNFSQLNQILHHAQNNQNKYLRDSQFKFKPLSLSPDNKIHKSRNLLKTLDTKKFQILPSDSRTQTKSPQNSIFINPNFQDRGNHFQPDIVNERQYQYRESGLQSPRKSSQKLETPLQKQLSVKQLSLKQPHVRIMRPEQIQIKDNENGCKKKTSSQSQIQIRKRGISQTHFNMQNSMLKSPQHQNQYIHKSNQPCCKCKNNEQFKQLISQVVIKNQQNQNIVKQLQQFCKMVCEQVQVPSFCKMLALIEE